jgi:hypothetical protein
MPIPKPRNAPEAESAGPGFGIGAAWPSGILSWESDYG